MSTTGNGRALIRQVKIMANDHHWTRGHARNVARIALMTAYTETNLQNYANANVHGSLSLPHEATGYDHDSVGIMQQRVGYDGSGSGGWGSMRHCQTPAGATESFVKRLISQGGDRAVGPYAMGVACQNVQVSAFPDRYEGNYDRAGRFLAANWGTIRPWIKNRRR